MLEAAAAAPRLAGVKSFVARAQALTAVLDDPTGPPPPEHVQAVLAELRAAWRELDPVQRREVEPVSRALAQRVRGVPRLAPSRAPAPALPGMEPAIAGLGPPPASPRLYQGPADPDALLAWMGHPSFRTGQREAVAGALTRRDSLVVMPTGAGKSLCYQLPGLAGADLTLVVSPLVALMSDQHQRLWQAGHPVAMIASGQGSEAHRAALSAIRDGRARLVLVSPERFASQAFNGALQARRVDLFVVDEAHCLSEWGHDFRPDYLRLPAVIERLGRPPVMAVTATATPVVAREIAARLGLRDPLLVHGGFNRPNLSFDVISLDGRGAVARKHGLLAAGLSQAENLPAIVYCGTRRDVEEVCERLARSGLSTVAYHAGLAPAPRTRAQEDFMSGRAEVVVATNAFGMGVDKADVRSVWHWALPTSVEAYYQEAGRAGRDGAPARAVLLSMRADLGRLISFNQRRSTTVARVELYLAGLARQAAKAGVAPPGAEESRGLIVDSPREDEERLCLAIAERAGACRVEPAGGGRLLISALGRLDRRRAATSCETARARGWEAYRAVERFSATHDVCRRRQILDHFGDQRPVVLAGRCCDVCDPPRWLPEPAAIPAGSPVRAGHRVEAVPGVALTVEQAQLLDVLRAWRSRASADKPAYTVAANRTLEQIVRRRPTDERELLEITGVGPAFVERHAAPVLALLAEHR